LAARRRRRGRRGGPTELAANTQVRRSPPQVSFFSSQYSAGLLVALYLPELVPHGICEPPLKRARAARRAGRRVRHLIHAQVQHLGGEQARHLPTPPAVRAAPVTRAGGVVVNGVVAAVAEGAAGRCCGPGVGGGGAEVCRERAAGVGQGAQWGVPRMPRAPAYATRRRTSACGGDGAKECSRGWILVHVSAC
jgi:hypothetical protein